MNIVTKLETPIGPLTLTASEHALTGVYFPRSRHKPRGKPGTNAILEHAKQQLTEYFERTRTSFDVPLDATGTDFERRVWELLRGIPYGTTTSYGKLAQRMGGGTNDARAVGAANGKNPIPIIVPCHRVIGANGDLTGFGGGLDLKRWLLEHEGALLRLGALCLALFVGTPRAVHPQVPRSQHGSVTQRVATTDVSVTYNRPVARGRELFGALVRWGRRWHPGADSATTISFSKDVTIDGQALKAGRYTLWLVPEESKPWTVIFNRGTGVWHTNYPGDSLDALRLEVTPESGGHMETLAYYFPMVDADSAELRMHWGTVVLPLKIKAPD